MIYNNSSSMFHIKRKKFKHNYPPLYAIFFKVKLKSWKKVIGLRKYQLQIQIYF